MFKKLQFDIALSIPPHIFLPVGSYTCSRFPYGLGNTTNANASKKEHTTLVTLVRLPLYRRNLIFLSSQSYPTSWPFSSLVHLNSMHGGYENIFNLMYKNHKMSRLRWIIPSRSITSEFCLSFLQWKGESFLLGPQI